MRCIDADPVNRSLGQFKALRAEKLDLVNQDGLIQRTRYDGLLERFATETATFVVDSGATAFMPFWTYVVETEMTNRTASGRTAGIRSRANKRRRNAE